MDGSNELSSFRSICKSNGNWLHFESVPPPPRPKYQGRFARWLHRYVSCIGITTFYSVCWGLQPRHVTKLTWVIAQQVWLCPPSRFMAFQISVAQSNACPVHKSRYTTPRLFPASCDFRDCPNTTELCVPCCYPSGQHGRRHEFQLRGGLNRQWCRQRPSLETQTSLHSRKTTERLSG